MIYLASLIETTEDKLNGYTIIKTKDELNKVVADNTASNRVIIRRDFAREYFTPTGLNQYLSNVKSINPSIILEIDEKSEVITNTRFIEKIRNAKNEEEMFILFSMYPKEFMDAMQELTRTNWEGRKEVLAASNTVSQLQGIIDGLRKEKENLEYALRIEQANKLQTQSKLDALVKRINYQYGVGVDPKLLFEVKDNGYDKIIYIKEITRVQYVDTFVYYLKEILKILYNMPTRLLVIESYYASGKESLYPNLVPHNSLREQDVISGDILMYGMQPRLMKDIMKNASNISILIVLDRGGYIAPHLRGKNVEYFYTASDLADVPEDVPRQRVISYDDTSLFIPYVEGFKDMDAEAKVTAYSSTGIMKKFVGLVEGR